MWRRVAKEAEMAELVQADRIGPYGIATPYRRRASDRARERASRAAHFGDRVGLLIATGQAVALASETVPKERRSGLI
jgi:hypothetical protein